MDVLDLRDPPAGDHTSPRGRGGKEWGEEGGGGGRKEGEEEGLPHPPPLSKMHLPPFLPPQSPSLPLHNPHLHLKSSPQTSRGYPPHADTPLRVAQKNGCS